jgi:hypothetical protein
VTTQQRQAQYLDKAATQAAASWSEIIEDPEVDAVVIGTWPYLHHTLVLAALAANKHVLTEARLVSHMSSLRHDLFMFVNNIAKVGMKSSYKEKDSRHACMHAWFLLPHMHADGACMYGFLLPHMHAECE